MKSMQFTKYRIQHIFVQFARMTFQHLQIVDLRNLKTRQLAIIATIQMIQILIGQIQLRQLIGTTAKLRQLRQLR